MSRPVITAALCILLLSMAGSVTPQSRGELLRLLGGPRPPPWWGALGPDLADLADPADPADLTDLADPADLNDGEENGYENNDDDARVAGKRSAVGAAIHAGRRRRQPAPAFGKPARYINVGFLTVRFSKTVTLHVFKSHPEAEEFTNILTDSVLNDVGLFFDNLRDNLQTISVLTPQQRARFLAAKPPHVVAAKSRAGGVGFRKLQAFRPLRPPGSTKSYNRRSYEEIDGVYPAANRHDPGLLWTGLGR